MQSISLILTKIADILFKPFYRYLFFFPFNLKVGKYPFYKQLQYLHFRITLKNRKQNEIINMTLSNKCNYFLEINPGKDFHQMHLFMAGIYEKNISENILKDLETAAVFVDVGAYIGYYSLMATTAFPEAQVYAIEPQKEAFEMLRKNTILNNKTINLFNCALGPFNEDKTLNINKFPEQSSLLSSDSQITENYKVQVKRLDDLLALKDKNVVIKIDTEGYEFEVVKGMAEIISNNNCVIYFEYNPEIYQQQFGPVYCSSFFEFMHDKGYEIFDVNTEGKRGEVQYNSKQKMQQNLVARKNN